MSVFKGSLQMKQKLDYNLNWGEYFQLNENSPSGLVRIKDYRGKDVKDYNVGTKSYRKNGDSAAWKVSFNIKSYQVHRIIWVLIHGSIDNGMVIDHLDGNPFNNKIKNLALKSLAGNARNRHKQKDNKTGITGVYLSRAREKYYYVANWYNLNGILCRKSFSIDKLGEDKAKKLAQDCRETQIESLILEGADYTERHGTELLILNKQEII